MTGLKDIPGYEGRYAITEDGQVWSYPKEWWGHKHDGMWLKQTKMAGSYWCVSLTTKGKDGKWQARCIAIHRLVARAFVPPVEGKTHVNHIDHTRTNNHYTNLEWVTRSENTQHAANIGRMDRYIPHKYTKERVNLIKELSNNGLGRTHIARLLDMPHTTVSAIARGVMRTRG